MNDFREAAAHFAGDYPTHRPRLPHRPLGQRNRGRTSNRSICQRWLKSLNTHHELAWTKIAKMRGVMSRIYKVGILHEHVLTNPVLHVQTRPSYPEPPLFLSAQSTGLSRLLHAKQLPRRICSDVGLFGTQP
jgi:hypothetical protein